MAKILSDSQLKRLSEHKYSAGGVSLLEPFLQPFWRWLVEQIPLWVAPNLLTIAGLILNIGTTLILIYYSPDAKSEVSRSLGEKGGGGWCRTGQIVTGGALHDQCLFFQKLRRV